jgi:hypothetical protein
MSNCFDMDECDCDCHRYGPGEVLHCMPCCFPCGKCGKNIMTAAFEKHSDECDGDLNLNWDQINWDGLKSL